MAQNTFVLDPEATGHHPWYLRLLVELAGHSEEGENFHFYVGEAVKDSLSGTECVKIHPARELGNVLDDQIQALRSMARPGDRIFLPRVNTYMPALLKVPMAGLPLSGIWFSPQSASWVHGGGLDRRLRGLLELFRMRRLASRCGLQKLFVLNDPRTAAFLNRWGGIPQGVDCLADPVPGLPSPSAGVESLRQQMDLAAGIPVFGIFGALRKGKGIESALRTFAGAERDCVLVVAGQPLPDFQPELEDLLKNDAFAGSKCQLVTFLHPLSDQELSDYLALVDYLLLPYEHAWGSSGFLGLAAHFGKPVLASKQGLLGGLVREFKLGLTFDPGIPSAFSSAIHKVMDSGVSMDPTSASDYVRRNSEASFRQTLSRHFART